MSLDKLAALFEKLLRRPRYVNDAPKTIQDLTRIVVEDCDGDAANIWKGKSAAEVKNTFVSIHGVGPGIANMGVLLIEKGFGVRFSDLDRTQMDIKPDVHTVRVLYRLGASDAKTEEAAITATRKMHPDFPGELDGALWEIGRRWCDAIKPDCPECVMGNLCVKRIGDDTKSNKPGKLTALIGESLNFEGFDVYYDHGMPGPFVGNIVSSISKLPKMGEELSQLDIAIIEKTTKKAVALFEIEETTDTPKTLLGDIFGILLGESISFGGNSSDWKMGNWTTLIIIGKGKNHEKRNGRIREMALKAKSALTTENSKIGNIVVESFVDEEDLEKLVRSELDKVFKGEL